jgi:flagellin
MVLTITTNTSAINVQRNLNEANEAAASSLAKLSSGSRVPTAKDDAASLAIGSRVEAEIAGLKQASVNASQATSLLQIADGAYGEINDILVRQSTLAIQSSSGQLSDSERAILDSEFQQLTAETDRIAQDTEFNGTQLINGTGNGTFSGTTSDAEATVSAAGTVEGEFTVDFTAGAGANSTGLFELKDSTGTVVDTYDAAAASEVAGTDAFTVSFGTAGVDVDLTTSFGAGNSTTNVTITEGRTAETSFDFKVGTGTQAQDSIDLNVKSASASALGTDTLDITSQTNANVAIDTVKAAIDTLQNNRAEVGASLSRLDFASSNLSVAIENQSAAKSGLLDVDVASETTEFAAQQVIVQAGVSLLAQANQQPSQLTKLIG